MKLKLKKKMEEN